jgi:hypothetical protein
VFVVHGTKIRKLSYSATNMKIISLKNCLICVFRQSDGPVVWGVAVRVRAGEFFAGHGRWNEIVTSR